MKLFTSCKGSVLPLKLKYQIWRLLRRFFIAMTSGLKRRLNCMPKAAISTYSRFLHFGRNDACDQIALAVEPPSTTARQLSHQSGYPAGTSSWTAPTFLRQLFDRPSTALRRLFDKVAEVGRRPVEEQWESTRTSVGAGTCQVMCKCGKPWEGSRSMVGRNPLYQRAASFVFTSLRLGSTTFETGIKPVFHGKLFEQKSGEIPFCYSVDTHLGRLFVRRSLCGVRRLPLHNLLSVTNLIKNIQKPILKLFAFGFALSTFCVCLVHAQQRLFCQ